MHERQETKPETIARPQAARLMELYLWALIAILVGGRALFIVMTSAPEDARFIIRDYYWDFVLTTLVFVFPMVYKLIFGALPLEQWRDRRTSYQSSRGNQEMPSTPTDGLPKVELATQSEINNDFKLLYAYSLESRLLAKGIYGRAGVYLLVGVLVAFSGLAFFYAQTPSISASTDTYSLLINLAPKFGILFFIEFVAFFFLKQYRAAMDEFRYYDGIARVREEVLALLQISAANGKGVAPLDLVKYDSYFSRAGVLSKGQSTEILEARRLEGSDLDVVQKALEILAKPKK